MSLKSSGRGKTATKMLVAPHIFSIGAKGGTRGGSRGGSRSGTGGDIRGVTRGVLGMALGVALGVVLRVVRGVVLGVVLGVVQGAVLEVVPSGPQCVSSSCRRSYSYISSNGSDSCTKKG